jgi:hypothetical protein
MTDRATKALTKSARQAETMLTSVAAQLDSTVLNLGVEKFKEARVVYRLDPDLQRALMETDLKVVPPHGAIAHLPYGYFVVSFGDPIEVFDDEEGVMRRFEGVMVHGLPAAARVDALGWVRVDVTEASSPDSVQIRGTFYGTLTESGRAQITTTSIPLYDEEPLEHYFARMASADEVKAKMRPAQASVEGLRVQPDIQIPLGMLLWQVLLYLASPEPDVTEHDVVQAGGSRRAGTTVIDVGWRVGSALRQAHTSSDRQLGGTVRAHVRRGHWHTYLYGPDRAERRLKWVHPTIINRGDPIAGVVFGDGGDEIEVGVEYVRANEDLTSEGEYLPAPDVRGRGAAVHARLQNMLADHLMANGRTPLTPTVDDPQYDLAWEEGDVIVVVEVKSLGPDSETQQLRLGLGQVIEYRYNMAVLHGRGVRAVLFVEHAPDESWSRLCEEEQILLAHPGNIDSVLTSM